MALNIGEKMSLAAATDISRALSRDSTESQLPSQLPQKPSVATSASPPAPAPAAAETAADPAQLQVQFNLGVVDGILRTSITLDDGIKTSKVISESPLLAKGSELASREYVPARTIPYAHPGNPHSVFGRATLFPYSD
jgi:hypothetical protein